MLLPAKSNGSLSSDSPLSEGLIKLMPLSPATEISLPAPLITRSSSSSAITSSSSAKTSPRLDPKPDPSPEPRRLPLSPEITPLPDFSVPSRSNSLKTSAPRDPIKSEGSSKSLMSSRLLTPPDPMREPAISTSLPSTSIALSSSAPISSSPLSSSGSPDEKLRSLPACKVNSLSRSNMLPLPSPTPASGAMTSGCDSEISFNSSSVTGPVLPALGSIAKSSWAESCMIAGSFSCNSAESISCKSSETSSSKSLSSETTCTSVSDPCEATRFTSLPKPATGPSAPIPRSLPPSSIRPRSLPLAISSESRSISASGNFQLAPSRKPRNLPLLRKSTN